MTVRILVGPCAAPVNGASGMDEPEREGATEAAKGDATAFFPLPDPFPTGADTETPCRETFSSAFLGTAVAYSESFSPTQDRANQRPPAIPRISRWATRQRLTFSEFLSKTAAGAKPV